MSKSEHEIEVLLKQNEEPKDFIQNCQTMGKSIQMGSAFKQIKFILKKALKGPIKYEKLESCIKILAEIASTDSDLFVDGETPQLVFSKTIENECNETQEATRSSIIDIILAEIATVIFEVNEEGKSAVLAFVRPCLDLLADTNEQLRVRREATKFLNIAIESFIHNNRELGPVPFVENFKTLLVTAGDLELQLCMTELIFRMLSHQKRQSYALKWFEQNTECHDDFVSIRDSEFESDCRTFLNNLNERQLENRSVYSIPCKKVYLGVQKVKCPSDEENGTFWTDFNLGSKSISFFAFDKESDIWLTVAIKQNVILKAQILDKKESHEILLLIQLNEPAHTLLPFLNQKEEKYVKLVYDENNPLIPVSLLLPNDFPSNPPPSPDVISSTPKASVTSSAVQLSSRNKGLSKAVSLLTPRRKKEESSDSSPKPNVDVKNENDKTVSKKKETSRRRMKDDSAQNKDSSEPDKEEKPSVGDDCTKTAEKVKDNPNVSAVSHGEGCRPRTRSSRNIDPATNNDQTEKGEQGKDIYDKNEEGENEHHRTIGESGLGKSIDSGLEKSLDGQDLTMEGSKSQAGQDECLKDMSQDEPTIIHETQSLSQSVNDGTCLDKEVLSKDQDEDPLIAKSHGVDDAAMEANAAHDDEDSSSGPFFKTSVTTKTTIKKVSEEDEGEHSTAFKTKPTKAVKAKAMTKTRAYRTRAATKLPSVSTSESEVNITARKIKARSKSAESGSKGAKTRTRSADEIGAKNKLGTGYNTEDWMLGWSDLDRRAGKKKELQNPASSSRLSLVNTVYRESLKSDFKRKRQKLSGPFEFKCSPPAKRNPQGKKLLRPDLRGYQLKKKVELQKKGKSDTKEDESIAYEEPDEKEPTFSDIALEVQRKHREREQRKHHSEGEVFDRSAELEADEQGTKDVVDDDDEKPKHDDAIDVEEKKQNEEIEKELSETTTAKAEEVSPAVQIDDSVLVDDSVQQDLVDITAEPDQETFDAESLPKLLKEFFNDKPSEDDENVDRNIADRKGKPAVVKAKKQDVINQERDDEGKDKGSPKIREKTSTSKSENSTGRSAREISVKSNRKEYNSDYDGKEVAIEIIENQKNEKQVDRSRAQRGTKSRVNFNKEKILTRNTEQTRKKQNNSNGENDYEIEENRKEEGSAGRTRKRIPRTGKFVTENDDEKDYLSSDTCFIVNAFTKNLERIIEDSDDCMDRPSNVDKTSSLRKKSETISRNKNYSKSSRDVDHTEWEEEHLYHPHEPLRFEVDTPKGHLSHAADSGFFDKTGSSSSKKRSYDQRNQTPGSAKSDVRDETPGGKVTRRSRRFGRIAMQSSVSCSPRQGYHSHDDKQTPRLQGERQSSEEDGNLFSHSQPVRASNQGNRKRKATRETKFKLGPSVIESKAQQRKKSSARDHTFDNSIDDLDGGDYVDDSFKTPVDSQSIPIQPRKLFQSSDHHTAQKRRKISRESRDDDDGTGDENMTPDDEADDASSIGEEMRTSFANLRNEVKKTIKQRQDYVTQMAAATMKFVSAKSQEIWSKQSSRRNALMNEFKNRMNKYMEDDRQIVNRQQQIEDEMFSQVKIHLEDLASQRKEHEKCMRGIIKTQKTFVETFKSIEDAEQSQQMDFYKSLRMELKRYRDEATKEVQKQEFENIKRRIQAMLGMSL